MLDELLQRLGAMGIEPLGTLEKIPSLVEYRVWGPVTDEASEQDGPVSDVLEAAVAAASKARTEASETVSRVDASISEPLKSHVGASNLLDLEGNLQMGALAELADIHHLKVEDRRTKGGGLWVTGIGAQRDGTEYAETLEAAGFKWSDGRGAWYFR